MEYRRLGNTGLVVSKISWGTVEIGVPYGLNAKKPLSVRDARRIVRGLEELGINLIDTAPRYGESETLLGEALGEFRDRFIVCTKWDPKKGNALESVEGSLCRLKTDHLDIVKLHDSTAQDIRDSNILDQISKLKKSGKVCHFGASVYEPQDAWEALKHPEIEILQLPYNFLERRFEEIIRQAAIAGVGVIARSVFFRGLLTKKVFDKNRTKQIKGRAEMPHTFILGLIKKYRLKPTQIAPLALRFVLGNQNVASALVGTRQFSNLRTAAADKSFGSDKFDAIVAEKYPQQKELLDLRNMFVQ